MASSGFKIDFILIGTAKAATSWIYEFLREHPEICVSSQKELYFFDRDYNFRKGINYYKKFFKNCSNEKIIGEFTPSYIDSRLAPIRIYKFFPDIKIIANLRNPIERIFSDYKFNVQMKLKYGIYKSFDEAVRYDKELIELGFYYKKLIRYFKIFPKKNILILFFDDLIKNPFNFVKEIYKFLKLKDIEFIPESLSKKSNPTGFNIVRERIPLISSIMFRMRTIIIKNYPNKRKFIEKVLNKTNLGEIIFKFLEYNRIIISEKNPEIDKFSSIKTETKNYLKKIYLNDIKNLERLLNVNLSHWK
ncbi:MAG: sulfotransferase family protein [Promethearchaeota archaeon]